MCQNWKYKKYGFSCQQSQIINLVYKYCRQSDGVAEESSSRYKYRPNHHHASHIFAPDIHPLFH